MLSDSESSLFHNMSSPETLASALGYAACIAANRSYRTWSIREENNPVKQTSARLGQFYASGLWHNTS